MYAIALGVKTVETRSWPVPARLVGQTIAIRAGWRVVGQSGDSIEFELPRYVGDDWSCPFLAGSGAGHRHPVRMVHAQCADL